MNIIRVLHLFSPGFGHFFSGHHIRWLRQFQLWNDNKIQHFILLPSSRKIISAKQVTGDIKNNPFFRDGRLRRMGNVLWAFQVLFWLVLYRSKYNVLHVHVPLMGALIAAPLIKILGRSSLFEISLLGSDNPSVIAQSSLAWAKLWCFRRYDNILCISEALKQDCLLYGFEDTRVHVLLNPVDSTLFAPAKSHADRILIRKKLGLSEQADIVLFVGSIKYRKGIDLLLGAFTSMSNKYHEFFLLIVGPDSSDTSPGVEDSFVNNLKASIERTGLSERVLFMGRVDDDQLLADYYRVSDIFVFPSRREGLGNVLLEAMSAGLPSIVSKLPGITDQVVRDGINGFLVPQDDPARIAEMLKLLLEDRKVRQRIGAKARSSVLENHYFNLWQNRLVQTYKSLIYADC